MGLFDFSVYLMVKIKTYNVNAGTDKWNTNRKRNKEKEEIKELLLIVHRLMAESIEGNLI